jgi:hypothetical protein
VQLVSALAVVHNFIHLFNLRDKELNEKHIPHETSDNTMIDTEHARPTDDQGNASRHREDITQAMWRDYEARSCCR